MNCPHCNEDFIPKSNKQKKFCSRTCQCRFNIKQWRKNNPEKDAVHKRKYFLKKDFGITLSDYERMFEEQNGKCKICMKEYERSLVVDHCHETKRVRGLLCDPCNLALGLFKDNPKTIASALEYVA